MPASLGDRRVGFRVIEFRAVRTDDDVVRAGGGGPVAGAIGGVPRENRLRPGVGQTMVDLACLEQWVHRHHHDTGTQESVVQDRELRDVGEHHADAIAGPLAALARPPGNT